LGLFWQARTEHKRQTVESKVSSDAVARKLKADERVAQRKVGREARKELEKKKRDIDRAKRKGRLKMAQGSNLAS
jgi:hypothetical protein